MQFTVSDSWRGHEQKIIYLYEAFRDFGYVEEQCIVCRKNSKIYDVAKSKGYNVIGLDFKSEYNLRVAFKLKKLSQEFKSDVIFVHSSKAHTVAVLASLFFRMKSSLVICQTRIKRIDTNFLKKWKYNYSGVKKIICVSQPVVDILKGSIKNHLKLSIVGSVVDVKKFTKSKKDGLLHREYNIPADYKIIGNVGALDPVKDIPTWIKTIKILVDKGVKAKYVLIGEGPLEEKIKLMISDLGLENHVILTGFRKDVPDCLPEFDLFLFTSKSEATGGVVLESYACKVPVVAANAGGIPTVLEDGVTGLLAEVGNPDDFAEKVICLLNDVSKQEELVKNAYQFLIDTSIKEVIAEKMITELKSSYSE